MSTNEPTVDDLLIHAAWVHHVAGALVGDPAAADDVVQETWLVAMRRPPRTATNLRAWLAGVVRRVARQRRRTERRRDAREERAARPEADASTAELVERVQLQRDLATRVVELDEPFRTTLILRFYEGLPPREIAAELDVPVATVRSRLQRGLARLRERLDGEHGGDRARWIALVAPLARSWSELATVPTVGTALGGSTVLGWWSAMTAAMQSAKGMAAVAGVVTIGLVTWLGPWNDGDDAPEGPATDGVVAFEGVAVPGPDRDAASVPVAERAAVARDRVATPSATPRLPGRLVDLAGQPVAGARLRVPGPHAVRWQAGDFGWLANDVASTKIDEDQLASFADPATLDAFVERFRFPDEWRTALVGTAQPEREVVTDADGRFGAIAERAFAPREFVAADPDRLVVGCGRERGTDGGYVLVVVPAVTVAGNVRDFAGDPLPDAFARVAARVESVLPPRFLEGLSAWTSAVDEREIRTDRDGRFRLQRVPVWPGASLRVRRQGARDATVDLPTHDVLDLDVYLAPASVLDVVVVSGRVVEPTGRPAVGARVVAGRSIVRADADGRFELNLTELPVDASLTVMHEGWQPLQRPRFGRELADDPRAGYELELVLPGPAGEVRGRVLGSDGRPLRGARVMLADPTWLDFSFSSVESRVSKTELPAPVDADGRFVVGGLADRSYRLRAVDPATGVVVVSEPVRPGAGRLVELRVAADATVPVVRGRVVDAAGRPVTNARIGVGFDRFVTKSGARWWAELPPVALESDGSFELRDVPRRHVFLELTGRDRRRAHFRIEDVLGDADPLAVEIVDPPAVRLRVEAADWVDAFAVLDADGEPLPVRAADDAVTRVRRNEDGAFPTVRVPGGSGVAAVVVFADGREVDRRKVSIEPGSRTRIVFP